MTRADKKIDRNRHSHIANNGGGISLSFRSIRPVLLYTTARGYDVNALLRAQGVDPILLHDPEARLPHTAAIRLWQAAAELTNDKDLGLHVAEAIQPGQFGALDYTVRTSANVEAAFSRLCRYHRLLHDA